MIIVVGLFAVAGARCRSETEARDLVQPLAASSHPLEVSPSSAVAGTRLDPLTFDFTVSATIEGGGQPEDLDNSQAADNSVLQIELPFEARPGATDEQEHDARAGHFDAPVLCWTTDRSCKERAIEDRQDGYWTATWIRTNGMAQPLQVAIAIADGFFPDKKYQHVLGVYLPEGQRLGAGSHVVLRYRGYIPARSTDWTDRAMFTHFRYRTSVDSPWVELDENEGEVAPFQILADCPWFVRVLAPLDVEVGVFTAAIVVTDRYGNPTSWTGTARLEGPTPGEVDFAGEWRKELEVEVRDEGFFALRATLDGLAVRSVAQYVRAWAEPPGVQRLLGDVHIHTGDGGAQRKFLGVYTLGDHAALFTRTQDALGYLDRVAGYDFGAVSEHSTRDQSYRLPEAVAAAPDFRDGGQCNKPPEFRLRDDTSWWPKSQEAAVEYQREREEEDENEDGFIVFPSWEWHSQHIPTLRSLDLSPIHRVVLFRDFESDLPLLPGDLLDLSPRCLLEFLELTGYGSDRALVIPHMMVPVPGNWDWDLTYADTSVQLADGAEEDYQRIGEIYSARAVDAVDLAPRIFDAPLELFEGTDGYAGSWTYRYAWKDLGVHIGVIGSSDSHSQMPGVDDTVDLAGERYHSHEPGGTAVVLARSHDRDGVYDALRARASYATTGVRAWLSFDVDGSPMGSEIDAAGDEAMAELALAVGMTIRRVELWGAPSGNPGADYQLLWQQAEPRGEIVEATVLLENPLPEPRPEVGAAGPVGLSAQYLYYVRAFLDTPGDDLDDPEDQPEDAVWSSPIWVRWHR